MAYGLLRSMGLLANAATALGDRCVPGMAADEAACRLNLQAGTALLPTLGHDRVAELARSMLPSRLSLDGLLRSPLGDPAAKGADQAMTGALPKRLMSTPTGSIERMPPPIHRRAAPNQPGLTSSRSLASGMCATQVATKTPNTKKKAPTAQQAKRRTTSGRRDEARP